MGFLYLLCYFFGFRSTQSCAFQMLFAVQLADLGLPKEGRGVTDWKKPVPEPVCNLTFMQAYICAVSGAAWVGHCQSVLVKPELFCHWSCALGSILIRLSSTCLQGAQRAHGLWWEPRKSTRAPGRGVLEHTTIIMLLIILHFSPFP